MATPPLSFSYVNNRPPNSTRRQLTVVNTSKPALIPPKEHTSFGFSFASTQDRLEPLEKNKPLYILLNLVDTVACDETLVFNNLRLYITGFLPSAILLEAGVFKLEAGAVFGNNTTYENNSTLIGTVSEALYIKKTDGPKADGLGFHNIKWNEDVRLPVKVDDIEQKYFLCFFLRASGNITLLSQNTNWNVSDLENYAYFDDSNTNIIFPTTMGQAGAPPGYFPYFTLYKT
tara:strand:- start:6279 stop:6971 length:693 start_codon:yes stop_codon:yes gene_type:complete